MYSNERNLNRLKEYFEYKFDLKKNKNDIMVSYTNDFWFSCRRKSDMEKIENISLSDIYKSCNSVESMDESFYDEEDLLDELNSLVENNDIVDYIRFFLEEVYGATCIEEE